MLFVLLIFDDSIITERQYLPILIGNGLLK